MINIKAKSNYFNCDLTVPNHKANKLLRTIKKSHQDRIKQLSDALNGSGKSVELTMQQTGEQNPLEIEITKVKRP